MRLSTTGCAGKCVVGGDVDAGADVVAIAVVVGSIDVITADVESIAVVDAASVEIGSEAVVELLTVDVGRAVLRAIGGVAVVAHAAATASSPAITTGRIAATLGRSRRSLPGSGAS